MKPIFYYSSYQLIIVFIYLIIMSVISFFHFLLDHKFTLIESWAHRNGWEIISIAKISALFFILKFLEVKFPTKSYLKAYLLKNLQMPARATFAFAVFTLCYFFYSGMPQLNDASFKFTFTALSLVGNFVFYATDFLLIYVIYLAYPERRWSKRFAEMIIYSVLFYQVSKILMPFKLQHSYLTIFHFFNILLLFEIYKEKLADSLLYIILLACPMSALWGLDPVWGEGYSFFKFSKGPDFNLILLLWFLSIYYLYRRKKLESADPEY